MLSKIKYLLIILFIYLKECENQKFGYDKKVTIKPPREPRWAKWQEEIVNVHLTNMTAEVLRDVELKIRQAKTIQEKYKHRITYELGTIAAGIQETFAHMLEIYRTYSDLPYYVNNSDNLLVVLDAYHLIQGDYNQIRIEKDLFYKTLEKHDAARAEKNKQISELSGGRGVKGPYHEQLLKGEIPEGRRHIISAANKIEPQNRIVKNMSVNDLEPVHWEDFVDDNDDAPTLPVKNVRKRTLAGTSRKPAAKRIWQRGDVVFKDRNK